MNMSVIIAQREELDEIYREFAGEMDVYLRIMRENVDAVQEIVESLRNAWVSENYDDFRNSMNKGMEDISDGLDRGEKLRQVMIDQEKELSVAIDLMKQKYGG